MPCPSCASLLPDGARFCPSCGEAVAPGRVEERRIVTVLFADIVGFTGLAERSDPETVKRLIDECMDRLAAEIDAFGGTVDKFLGDGVLALFGAPVAHEDDAERAVRAALRMQDVIGEACGPDGAPLRLRIGVNTGEVLVGALRARSDYTAMGDAVNTAARLQTLAPPGRVLVGSTTHHLTSDVISYEAVGAVFPRGREQAVEAWLAVAPTALPGGRRHRFDLPIVGRDPELAVLSGAIELAFSRRRAALIVLEAEGGVGKSRIVAELVSRARDQLGASTATGSCVPYGENNVWWPLTSALIEAGEQDGMRSANVLDAGVDLSAKLAELGVGDDPAVLDALAYLLGQPSSLNTLEPARAREALTPAVIALVRAHARRTPFLMTITDLQWADPVVLTLLETALTAVADQPVVLVTTLRAQPDLVWPPTGGGFSTYRIRLEPLGRDATAEFLRTYLGGEVDPTVVDRLYERSGGNPLFLEELAGLVAEHGAIGELPDSLRALIAARLDQLPSDQRAVLDNAAVLGSSGRLAALDRFGEELGLADTAGTLQPLVEAGLLTVDNRRWAFRSESVREVAYQTLTKAARAQRHAGVARALLEKTSGANAEEIAHHFATAAELVGELGRVPGVPHDVAGQAVHWLSEATTRAVDQNYTRSAIGLATRALELVAAQPDAASPEARRRLLLRRAEAFAERRELARARADIGDALASAGEDLGDQARAVGLLGELERFDGRLPQARRNLDESIALWRRAADEHGLAQTLRTRGMLEVFGPSPGDAAPYLDEADELYLRLGDRAGHAWVEQNRAWESFLAGRVEEADERLHRAAAVMEELGDRTGIRWAFGLMAFVRFYLGNREEASQLADSVLRDAAERGDEWGLGMMQALQANLQLWEGHMANALALSDEAARRMRRIGDGYGQIQALAPGVRALVASGRYGEARTRAEEIHALAPRFGLEAFAALASSAASLHAGGAQRSLDRSEEAMEHASEAEGLGSLDTRSGRALAFVMLGALDDAIAIVDQLEVHHRDHPYVSAVSALIAAADRRPDDAVAAAQRVLATASATYLDRVFAGVAEASARLQQGDRGAALAALEPARMTVDTTDDLVMRAVVRRVHRSLDAEPSVPGEEEQSFPLLGWASLVDRLFSAEVPS